MKRPCLFMDGYVPTLKEFDEVRGQLVELAKDYLLLHRMNGRQSIVDMHIDCSDKAEGALQAAKTLMAQVNRIDVVADTDAEALGRIWPDVLDILENYSFHHFDVEAGVEVGVHEYFKPLWAAARNLGLSDGEIQEDVDKRLGPGRPRDRSPIARDLRELWRVGNQVLAHFNGDDPGQDMFARGYLRRRGLHARIGEYVNPRVSLLRRSDTLLGVQGSPCRAYQIPERP